MKKQYLILIALGLTISLNAQEPISPVVLTVPKPEIDASAISMFAKPVKTLGTTLSGCLAGDCFYGFGYLIDADGKTEYIGNFKNGIIEGLGQIHMAGDNIIYTGYFENNQPNGYGNINYYANNLIEVGTFKNTAQDGEFTRYQFDDVQTVLYKNDQKTTITRQTGCLLGDCSNGKGIYQKTDGSRIEGDFSDNRLVKGVVFESKFGVVKYDSIDINGQYNGNTVIFKPNGEVIYGTFKDSKMNGKMLIKAPKRSGYLYREGVYENGQPKDETILFRDGRKWVGVSDTAEEWATGKGTMTYPDGTTKTGKFYRGDFVSE
ncbi:hypothetical protein CYCD_24910 [Tenuifilaceae bacterium CYCD]|nr:hypothetical protein CYCD_24910 [Tenuifilaceae bacterium CYCD]